MLDKDNYINIILVVIIIMLVCYMCFDKKEMFVISSDQGLNIRDPNKLDNNILFPNSPPSTSPTPTPQSSENDTINQLNKQNLDVLSNVASKTGDMVNVCSKNSNSNECKQHMNNLNKLTTNLKITVNISLN